MQKKFNSITTHRIKHYPFDIYIPSLNIIIEADGRQHFDDINPYFGKKTGLITRIKNDNFKNNYCLKNNIAILRIPYIFNPDTEKDKIYELVEDFMKTKIVPEEILDFYKKYKDSIGSNYYDIATKLNESRL